MDYSSEANLRKERRHVDANRRTTDFNAKAFSYPLHQDRPANGTVERRYPRVVARCIAQYDGRVLLCQRADEPRRGFWNTPGGFIESGETPLQAIVRETLEECGVSLDAPTLGFIYEFPQMNEVVMTFLAEVHDPFIVSGNESLDSRFFATESIPWQQLAFPSDADALRRHYAHSAQRCRPLQIVECFWDANGEIFAEQRKNLTLQTIASSCVPPIAADPRR